MATSVARCYSRARAEEDSPVRPASPLRPRSGRCLRCAGRCPRGWPAAGPPRPGRGASARRAPGSASSWGWSRLGPGCGAGQTTAAAAAAPMAGSLRLLSGGCAIDWLLLVSAQRAQPPRARARSISPARAVALICLRLDLYALGDSRG